MGKSQVQQDFIVVQILLIIFLNDLFMFIQKCDICNYVDNTTLSFSGDSINSIKKYLNTDILIA